MKILQHPNGMYLNARKKKLQDKIDKDCLVTDEQAKLLLTELKNYKIIEYK